MLSHAESQRVSDLGRMRKGAQKAIPQTPPQGARWLNCESFRKAEPKILLPVPKDLTRPPLRFIRQPLTKDADRYERSAPRTVLKIQMR